MINRNELQKRDFPTVMDGGQFLTARTSSVMNGTTQLFYMGYAYPGSAEGDSVWMIQRVAIAADSSTVTLFAGGEALFNQVWANRASLVYS